MTFTELYELTPRSFLNAMKGFRKSETENSKQHWIRTRELMYAIMFPYLEKGVEKHNILPFQWEQKQLEELAIKKAAQIEGDLEDLNAFWERQDNAKKDS